MAATATRTAAASEAAMARPTAAAVPALATAAATALAKRTTGRTAVAAGSSGSACRSPLPACTATPPFCRRRVSTRTASSRPCRPGASCRPSRTPRRPCYTACTCSSSCPAARRGPPCSRAKRTSRLAAMPTVGATALATTVPMTTPAFGRSWPSEHRAARRRSPRSSAPSRRRVASARGATPSGRAWDCRSP